MPINKVNARSANFADFPSILEKRWFSAWVVGPLSKTRGMLSKRPHVWKVPGEVILIGYIPRSIFEMIDVYGVFPL